MRLRHIQVIGRTHRYSEYADSGDEGSKLGQMDLYTVLINPGYVLMLVDKPVYDMYSALAISSSCPVGARS
jgi:hypothetical protein